MFSKWIFQTDRHAGGKGVWEDIKNTVGVLLFLFLHKWISGNNEKIKEYLEGIDKSLQLLKVY